MIEIIEIKDHPTNKTTSYNPFTIDLWIRLLSFHSPLLRKSNFVYIPLPSNMFKFGRFSYMKLSTTHEWKFLDMLSRFQYYRRIASIICTEKYLDLQVHSECNTVTSILISLFQHFITFWLTDIWTFLTEIG